VRAHADQLTSLINNIFIYYKNKTHKQKRMRVKTGEMLNLEKTNKKKVKFHLTREKFFVDCKRLRDRLISAVDVFTPQTK